MKKVISGIRYSASVNQNYYREIFESQPINFPVKCKNIKIKIVVIIDRNNVSAALDFIDELKAVSNSVYLLGEKTNTDRLYMEVRSEMLPSKEGEFFFPIKVYRNRKRADNIGYEPDIWHNPKLINTHNILQILSENKFL